MPLNLIKAYNLLLDINTLSDEHRKSSLMGIFNKDIANHPYFNFRGKKITPTPIDGAIQMANLFHHLTTVMVCKVTRKREYDHDRSCRLHWVRFHIEERKPENILIFSVDEPEGVRTYIYDQDEKYVVILEPLRNRTEYYLLTAYHITGKDAKRDKFLSKYKKRRLPEVA